MVTSRRELQLSFNPELIDKNVTGETRLYAEGFQNVEATPEQIAEGVGSLGWAIAAQFSGNRSKATFLRSDVAFVDIDAGESLNEIRSRHLIQEHACLVYTTASHTEQAPRVRAVFALPITVVSAADFAALNRSLALRCEGDLAATDAARICFGSRGAQTFVEPGKVLPLTLLDELISQSRNRAKSVREGGAEPTRSALSFPPDLTVQAADGNVVSVSDLPGGTPLHCPYHQDRRPSAFTVKSKAGTVGIHCSTCATTFWPERADLAFEFDAFLKEARRVFAQGQRPGNEDEEA